jgi:hypothetical protein
MLAIKKNNKKRIIKSFPSPLHNTIPQHKTQSKQDSPKTQKHPQKKSTNTHKLQHIQTTQKNPANRNQRIKQDSIKNVFNKPINPILNHAF